MTTRITAAVSYPVGNCSVTSVLAVISNLGNNCSEYTEVWCSNLPLGDCTELPRC